VEQAVDAINDQGIKISVDTILGIPGQGEEDNIGFLEFCLRKRIKNIYFNWLRYFPKVDISAQSGCAGIKDTAASGVPYTRVQSLGGDVANKDSVKFMLLARLTKLIPEPLALFIMRNRIYRFFPGFLPLRFVIFSWESTVDSFDHKFFRRMDICMYKYYIADILASFLAGGNHKYPRAGAEINRTRKTA